MQLHVGGLTDDATEDEVRERFSKIGAVKSVGIIRDIKTGKSRGFGIVKMLNDADEDRAIKELDGTIFKNQPITVSHMPETLPGEMEFREWLKENASEVLQKAGIKRGQQVLDYGCGPGKFTIPCARIVGKQGKVYALDVRRRPLELINEEAKKEGLANIETMPSESFQLTVNLPDKSLDAVLVYDVMHQINDKQGLLKELHRLLKGDGLLSIYPMHLGTDKMMAVMQACDLFSFKGRYSIPGYQAASEVINFTKC